MTSNASTAYRVVAVFDSWSSDAILDFEHQAKRARRARRPPPRMPEAGMQDVILGGSFDRCPSANEVKSAVTTAGLYAQSSDGRAMLQGHYVLNEEQWIRLVGGHRAEIDADMQSAKEGGFASATMAASFPTGGAAEEAIETAINDPCRPRTPSYNTNRPRG